MFATDVCEMADNVLSFVRIFGAQILHICLLHNVGMALDYSSSSVAVRMMGHGISPLRRAFFTSKWVLTLLGRRNRCDEPFC